MSGPAWEPAADPLDAAAGRAQAELEATLAASRAQTDALFGVPVDPERCCADCDEPIGTLRLTAVPGAVRCQSCQGIAEHRARQRAGAAT